MAAEVFCKHMNRIVPDYSKINENVSMTGSIGFGDYDKEINYENALIGYCKRNNINNDELVEITPENIRLRKFILNTEARMKFDAKK